jgi:two-component system, NarL family, invasion response regulator UvrY
MTPNIIVADDHAMIRKGIKLLLTSRLGYKNVSEADSCNALLNELKKGGCSHLVLDVVFPDGTSLEIVPTIKKLYPDVKIMIFSMQANDIYADAFRQYDIQYYLNKSSGEDHTINYLRRFLNDEAIIEDKNLPKKTNPFSSLAPRELEVLHYLLAGHKTTDIAQTLNLGNSTVSTMKNRIFEKTGVSNIAQLIELASLYLPL